MEGYLNELTVKKVWWDNEIGRPASVTIRLLKDEIFYDEVELSNANNWTHSWENLEEGHTWRIYEVNVPQGYYVKYYYSRGTWTVRNTSSTYSLIQTGQLNWPILVMGGLGLALIALGIISFKKKRKKNGA